MTLAPRTVGPWSDRRRAAPPRSGSCPLHFLRSHAAARPFFVGSCSIALTADRQNCGGCTEMIRDKADGYGMNHHVNTSSCETWALSLEQLPRFPCGPDKRPLVAGGFKAATT